MTAVYFLVASLLACWFFTFVLVTYVVRKYRKGRFKRYNSVDSCPSAGSLLSVVPVTPLTTPQRQRRLLRRILKENPPNVSPEDYLAEAGHLLFTPVLKRRPVAAVTPRLARSRFPSTSSTIDEKVEIVRRKGMKLRPKAQRESQAPLTASVSELSVGGDEYEYDYYDIGGHYQMGSFFNADTEWEDHTYDVIASPSTEIPNNGAEMVAMKELKSSDNL